ncbi:serine hydrolase domain-containing protein [Polaribacter porphyrae]|uniref:Beta-lactamase-related domain-containing protein n=1 Tax=Polaribacter porphyrae TaxID=1137780 RepID=A0A2S7WNR4_9FLAO|nr:serine hydrolase domain-containing protein [Polaribacter porphyrae]PQJ79096.1 hypothetical protein BTO18_07905 [Polaribacter porphyrae]
MKKLYILIIITFFTSKVSVSQELPKFIKDSLDSYISQNIKKWNLPGLSIAIVKDGKTTHLKGYGVRAINSKEPVDETTMFQIASITKSFTATLVAMLHEEKKLSLNDKVTKWLPYFQLKDSTISQLVDIEDLLSHRIGFGNHQGDLNFEKPPTQRRQIIEGMSKLNISKKFRGSFGYSNKSFIAAGDVINAVTKKTWEETIQEKIFLPLNMSSTEPSLNTNFKYPNIAYPHTYFRGKQVIRDFVPITVEAPAGAILSNAKDMSNWLKVQLSLGMLNDKRVIPRRAIMQTRRVKSIQAFSQSIDARTHFYAYGLGYYIRDVEGYITYQHSGGGYGFSTNHVIVPEKGLAFIILTNSDVSDFYMNLTNVILDAFLDKPFKDYSKESLKDFEENNNQILKEMDSLTAIVNSNLKPKLSLNDFSGTYVNSTVGKLNIVNKNGKLKVLLPDYLKISGDLEYIGDNEFLCTFSDYDFGVIKIPFKIKNGKVESLILNIESYEDFDYHFVKEN